MLVLLIPSPRKKSRVKNPESPLFKNYSYEDGFLGISCSRNAIFEDNNGTIWVGTTDRLTAYHPEGDEPDTIPPNIQLKGISLFNENIAWADLTCHQPLSEKKKKQNNMLNCMN